MATRIEQLIDALVTVLENDPAIISGSVHRTRVEAFSDTELPAYSIEIGQDIPLGELGPDNVAFIDWQQSIFIDCYAKSVVDNIDSIFLTMRNNVHRSLMADYTQGLNFVMTTIPDGADEPILDDSGEQKTSVYRTSWIFRLRTSIGDLET
jgi:hypothetical protein